MTGLAHHGTRGRSLPAGSADAGILAVAIVAMACVVTAVGYQGSDAERYSPLNHWISELGEYGVSGLAVVFNGGLIVAGVGFALLHLRLFEVTTGRLRHAIRAIGLVTAVAGGLVGVFPMNLSSMHRIVAVSFFLTGWIAPALLAVRILATRRDGMPRWLVVPGLSAIAAFVPFLVVLGSEREGLLLLETPTTRPEFWLAPTLEWATLIAILAWTACVGFVLRTRADRAVIEASN